MRVGGHVSEDSTGVWVDALSGRYLESATWQGAAQNGTDVQPRRNRKRAGGEQVTTLLSPSTDAILLPGVILHPTMPRRQQIRCDGTG
jgi:hypothetical protein